MAVIWVAMASKPALIELITPGGGGRFSVLVTSITFRFYHTPACVHTLPQVQSFHAREPFLPAISRPAGTFGRYGALQVRSFHLCHPVPLVKYGNL